ncbi:MAG: hypothetical protein ACYTDY_06370, partial [Planctomycetota bacterium]
MVRAAPLLILGLVVAGAAALAWLTLEGPAPGPAPPPAPIPPGPSLRGDAAWGELAGRVANMDGAPVPDALVIAQDLRGFGGLVRTGPDG